MQSLSPPAKRAPPRTAPPISTEEMTVIKKRVAAPKGPPPKMLEGFRPKSMASSSSSRDRDDDYDQRRSHGQGQRSSRDIDDGTYEYGNGSGNSSGGGRRGPSPNMRSYDDYEEDFRKSDDKPPRHESRDRDSRGIAGSRERDRDWDRERGDSRERSMNSRARSDSKDSRDSPSRDRYDRRGHPGGHGHSSDSFGDDKYVDDEDDYGDRDEKSDGRDSKASSYVDEGPPRMSRNGRDQIFNFRTTVLGAKYKELRTFVRTPIKAGVVVRCYIERSRGSGTNFLSPCYSLCADMEDGSGKELISCRKIMKSKTAHYVFSMRQTDLYRKRKERSRVYLGKLRSISSSQYVMYDSGTHERTDTLGPDSIQTEDNEYDESEMVNSAVEDAVYKSQLCSIFYHTKTRPTSGLGMEVCVPAVPSRTNPVPGDLRTDLVKCFEKIRGEGQQNELYKNKCFVMQEKKSRYDPLSSCLVDFQGRATMASVKNFQLLESTPFRSGERKQSEKASDDEVIFQLGKVSIVMICISLLGSLGFCCRYFCD